MPKTKTKTKEEMGLREATEVRYTEEFTGTWRKTKCKKCAKTFGSRRKFSNHKCMKEKRCMKSTDKKNPSEKVDDSSSLPEDEDKGEKDSSGSDSSSEVEDIEIDTPESNPEVEYAASLPQAIAGPSRRRNICEVEAVEPVAGPSSGNTDESSQEDGFTPEFVSVEKFEYNTLLKYRENYFKVMDANRDLTSQISKLKIELDRVKAGKAYEVVDVPSDWAEDRAESLPVSHTRLMGTKSTLCKEGKEKKSKKKVYKEDGAKEDSSNE